MVNNVELQKIARENASYNNKLLMVFSSIAGVLYFGGIFAFWAVGNLDGVYIMLSFSGWLLIVIASFKYFFCEILINTVSDNSRMTLSYFAGAWALLSIIIFGMFQYIDRNHPIHDDDSALGTSFYKVGFAHPLIVFGMVIDNWWRYTLILIYQFTRQVINMHIFFIITIWKNIGLL